MNLLRRNLLLSVQIAMICIVADLTPTAMGLSAPKECSPPWYNASSKSSANDQCPYGIVLPGSVTWHTDNMNPIRQIFGVFYGYVAYVIPLLAVISAIVTRGTREILFIGSVGVVSVINEYCFKNVNKEPRPLGTCAITCGMPSGHSATTIHYFVLLMVAYVFRVDSRSGSDSELGLQKGSRAWRVLRLMSTSNVESISWAEFVALAFLWGASILPIPPSRVANLDHTWGQVIIGSALGIVCGLATYGIHCVMAKTVCRNAWQLPRETKWYLLKNTSGPAASKLVGVDLHQTGGKVDEASRNDTAAQVVGAKTANQMNSIDTV